MTTQTFLNIVVSVMDKATAALKSIKNNLTKLSGSLDAVNDGSKKFNMNILSLLFGGMALQRVFGGALRSLYNTYIQIIDVNDQFFQRTQALRAGWEFLKFSMMEALSQSELFKNIIEFLINAVNWLGAYINEHKKLGAGIAILMGIFALIGSIAIGWGMARQTGYLFLVLLADIKKMWTGLTVLIAANPLLSAILFLVFAVALFIWKVKQLKDEWGSLGNAFKIVGATILWTLGWIANGMFETLITPLRIFIGLLNLAIRAARSLGFTKIEPIKIPDWMQVGFVGKNIENMIMEKFMRPMIAEKNAAARATESSANIPGTMINSDDINKLIAELSTIPNKVKEGVENSSAIFVIPSTST